LPTTVQVAGGKQTRPDDCDFGSICTPGVTLRRQPASRLRDDMIASTLSTLEEAEEEKRKARPPEVRLQSMADQLEAKTNTLAQLEEERLKLLARMQEISDLASEAAAAVGKLREEKAQLLEVLNPAVTPQPSLSAPVAVPVLLALEKLGQRTDIPDDARAELARLLTHPSLMKECADMSAIAHAHGATTGAPNPTTPIWKAEPPAPPLGEATETAALEASHADALLSRQTTALLEAQAAAARSQKKAQAAEAALVVVEITTRNAAASRASQSAADAAAASTCSMLALVGFSRGPTQGMEHEEAPLAKMQRAGAAGENMQA